MIHAVGSGVGTAALQLAHLAGAQPVGTSRSQEKLDRCAALAPFVPVVPKEGSFAAQVGEVDVILDTIGAAYAAENTKALAPRGRWVMIGLLGGATSEIPLGQLLGKRATLIGSVLRSRPLEEKALLARRFSREILPLFATGRLRPIVDAILPIEQVAEAHRRMESDATFGKIVLSF